MSSVRPLLLVAALAVLAAARSAAAAEAEVTLEEVTVTAQKVSESLGNVPISLSVIDGSALATGHIADLADITRAVPNFSFSSNGNPGGSILEMRGISSAAGASPVSIYLDDVPVTQRLTGASLGQPEPDLLDVQQVEVLRGPQGTLYGASAEAGVLMFLSNPVDLSSFGASGSAQTSYTQDGGENYQATGVVDVPVREGTVGIRLAVQEDRQSGFIDRYSPISGDRVASDVNDVHSTVARLSIEAQPSSSLSILARLFYQRTDYGSTNTVTLGLPALSSNAFVPDGGSDKLVVPSLTVKYTAGWGEVTSVTSDYTRSAPSEYDGTVYNSAYIGECILNGACGGAPIPDLNGQLAGDQIAQLAAPAFDTSFSRVISQELRVNSKPYAPGEPVTWIAGVYYQQSADHHGDFEYIPQFNSVFTRLYGTSLLDQVFGGPLPDGLIYYDTYQFTEKQYSAFGNLTYHLTPVLRASAGVRYLTARFDVTQGAGGFFAGGSSGFTAQSRDHAVTPMASVSYNVTPRNMVYATASRGFRLGGPNAPLPSFCDSDLAGFGLTGAPQGYAHDSLWNYELGGKLQPLGALAVNADAFYDKWSQLQQSFYLPDCGSSFTTNVGAARSYGAEVNISARPARGLTIGVAGGYTNARLTEAMPAAGLTAGTLIEGVPDWSGSATAAYEWPIDERISAVVRGNYSYVGASHGSLIATDPDYRRPSYGLAGGSVGVQFDRWDVSLFVTNLFNDQKIIQTPDHASVPVGLALRPRTVGISVHGEL